MLTADTRSLRNMGRQLRSSQPDVYKATQKSLRDVGVKSAARAKQNASWSKRIPPTIRVSASGLNRVVIRAGGKAAPHAKPLENHGQPGEFRHPVFGNREEWVDQDARPFLLPAVTDRLKESAREVAEALTVQVEKILHGRSVNV